MDFKAGATYDIKPGIAAITREQVIGSGAGEEIPTGRSVLI